MSHPKKILVIDDSADHLLICQLVLEHRGYEVLALDGIETLEQLFETVYSFRPDVIFTDHDMPGTNGAEIVRMIKQVAAFNHIAVIYFSASEQIETLTRRTGADGFITKPLKTDELLHLLEKHTNNGH